MTFQALDLKEHQFLELCGQDNNPLEPLYSKDSTWLKYFGHLNSLYTRATRVIINHTPIGEYRLRFFHQEDFSCPYGDYPIETRYYILCEYRRFNKYWNLKKDSISHFILFLEFSCRAFSFEDTIT